MLFSEVAGQYCKEHLALAKKVFKDIVILKDDKVIIVNKFTRFKIVLNSIKFYFI